LKIQKFQKRLCISELFWLLQLFKSQLPTNILNLLNLKFRCVDKPITVSKLFLSFVNTGKNQKNLSSNPRILKFERLFFLFLLFYSKYSNHSHKCDDIEIQLCEKYWKFRTSFTKGRHLEQNNFEESSNSLPWVWTFFHHPFVMRKQVQKSHLFTRKILLDAFFTTICVILHDSLPSIQFFRLYSKKFYWKSSDFRKQKCNGSQTEF